MQDDNILRLYGVKDVLTGKTVYENGGELAYFSYKDEAKDLRDELTKLTGRQYAVILGPDHWKNKDAASPSEVASDIGM